MSFRSIISSLILLILPVMSLAAPFFSVTSSDYSITQMKNATSTVGITVTNNSGQNLGNITYNPGAANGVITPSISSTSCTSSLNAYASCTFNVSLASGSTAGSAQIYPKVCYAGIICSSLPQGSPIAVTVPENVGHLEFQQSGSPISELDLASGDSGTIMLKNTGTAAVTGLSVNEGDLADYFNSSSCMGTLAPGASCSISYDTTGVSSILTGNILATADNTDDELPSLAVTISPAGSGYLVFQQGGSDIIDTLVLTTGTSGSFTLKNTGSATVTGLSFIFNTLDSDEFDTSACTSLAPNASCTINYTSVTASTGGYIQVSGTNADNSPLSQNIDVKIGRAHV